MSDGYKNGAFALGLATGIGLVLNVFVWLDFMAQKDSVQALVPGGTEGRSQIGQSWESAIGDFVEPRDSLANWIIVFFTIVAVFLVWKTLVATQAMVIDARRIGEAQVRAYLTIEDCSIDPRREQEFVAWDVFFKVRNCGQSPARRLSAKAGIRNTWSLNEIILADVPANGEVETSVTITTDGDEDLNFFKDSETDILDVISVSVEVMFEDVFAKRGDRTTEYANFVGIFPLHRPGPYPLKPAGRNRGDVRHGNVPRGESN
ncbi:MAG: hypothetical protein HUJ27_10980 [Rhodobacteraceae bacterium]|nr:hypothetical protein [Paracoccaceae bacterium]